jgi:hypothetical protein
MIGLPVVGQEMKLAPVGDKLEVRFRGPNVTPGYWRQPELTRAAFDAEGYYKMGDALRFADADHPEKGLMFDGRLAEDFKLSTGTWASVGPLRTRFIAAGAPVKLVRVTKSMPGRARNLAVAESRCQWIAFTDAGTTLTPEWLEALTTKAHENSADVVYGTYEPIINSFFTECAAIAYVPPPFESDGGLVRPRSIVSALMRRQAWESVGGFPEHLRSAEDLLFMNQIERSPVVVFCQTMSALPSALKSPDPAIDHAGGTVGRITAPL